MSFQPTELEIDNATIKRNCLLAALLILLLLILWKQPRPMSFQPTQLEIDNATIKLNCLLAALLIMFLLILWMRPRDAELPAWKIWVNKLPQWVHEVFILCLAMFVVTYVN